MKKYLPLVFILGASFFSTAALAAGGLDAGKAEITNFKNWIYGTLFVISIVYLLFKCVQAYSDKITWVDVGQSCAKVAVMGGTPALATFLWGIWGAAS
jgi:hypothetical protein